MTGSADNPPRWLSLDEKKFYAIWTKAWHFPYYGCRAIGESKNLRGALRVVLQGHFLGIKMQH